VDYLTDKGYEAHWEQSGDGYILFTSNCPYHHISELNVALCEMDMRLISSLLNVVPRRITRVVDGDETCSYQIPEKAQMKVTE
jgi:predicted ArsR family transcriptional regulator